jgi:GNAT superfamily N-acetyltransferase
MIQLLDEQMVDSAIQIFVELPHFFNPLAINRLKEDIKSFIKKRPEPEEGGFYVYVEDLEVIGVIGYRRMKWQREYEITWLAVRKDRQRRGIGRSLLLFLENFLLKHSLQLIIVNIPNDQLSKNFYFQMGFRSINRFFDKDGEILVYEKRYGFIKDKCQDFVADYLRQKRLKDAKK